ncbi:MAG: 23S rRNA (uracil(1939)-C(5))-methyltransferase RlmD, partial [Clostridia bacterium]|nr:23S rRNA (uracil(1939)-C(5))-methyltransferase RlmD [Clostridia bacterium]
KAVTDWAKEKDLSIYNEAENKGFLRHIYIRKAAETHEIMVCLVINGDFLPESASLVEKLQAICGSDLQSVQININKKDTNVILGDTCKTVYGSDYITDILCGVKVRLSPLSFYQVNHTMAEMLYEKAKEYANPYGKNIIDLYCGAGTIGLSMASESASIIGVEIVPEAIKDAQFNAKNNGIENARFICADATAAAEQLANEGITADVVIVDPPRKGCTPEVIETIANHFKPERVVYVSCDSATLARDIKIFGEKGYKLVEYTPCDLFPRTAHVETVALLSREKANDCVEGPAIISDERSNYKSWSNLKKQMNDLLCDSLKDKISYFYTAYHEVHNVYGRATINYCKKEIAAFSWIERYTQQSDMVEQYKKMDAASMVFDDCMLAYEFANTSAMREKWMPNCILCETDFINSITIYLKTDIATSLNSDNYLLRLFAYMDRRVGKRTLIKIKDEVEKLPEWVKQFYQIRCESEGIVFPPKRMIDER